MAPTIMYCELCKRDVPGSRKFNWILFIILMALGFVPGIIYCLFYLMKPANKCPICGVKCLPRSFGQ